jgi:hypothetical protein
MSKKNKILLLITVSMVCLAAKGYDRSDFGFKSYPLSAGPGYYTEKHCKKRDVEHIVSLKDAFDSGAASWTAKRKRAFANDPLNHRAASASVNRSKGASRPAGFLRKSNDGKGRDYEIVNFCSYLALYTKVKLKYRLSFDANSKPLFSRCAQKI